MDYWHSLAPFGWSKLWPGLVRSAKSRFKCGKKPFWALAHFETKKLLCLPGLDWWEKIIWTGARDIYCNQITMPNTSNCSNTTKSFTPDSNGTKWLFFKFKFKSISLAMASSIITEESASGCWHYSRFKVIKHFLGKHPSFQPHERTVRQLQKMRVVYLFCISTFERKYLPNIQNTHGFFFLFGAYIGYAIAIRLPAPGKKRKKTG